MGLLRDPNALSISGTVMVPPATQVVDCAGYCHIEHIASCIAATMLQSQEAAMPHVIMTGNPIDGFQLFGPFTTQEEADRYVEQEADGIELWILPITDPAMLSVVQGNG